METLVAGVDIGGSHITAALVNIGSREVQAGSWKREAVDASGSAGAIIQSWVDVIGGCFDAAGINPSSVGIAMPGPFDYPNGISLIKDQEKFRSLYGMNVRQLLAERLEIAESRIRFSNDAACFLQGELFSGAGQEVNHAIGLTLGTGFGSAYSENGIAKDADLWCAPFRDNIAEYYFSNNGLVRKYEALTGQKIATAKELAAMALHDPAAKQVFKEFGAELAEFLSPVIERHSAELLVIGGNIAKAFPFFSPSLLHHLSQQDIRVHESVLGEDAALVGAASMWANYKGKRVEIVS
jgi:glucokinase